MLRDAKRMHFLWQPTPVQQEAIDKCIDTCLPQGGGEQFLKGWAVTSVNEWGGDQERLLVGCVSEGWLRVEHGSGFNSFLSLHPLSQLAGAYFGLRRGGEGEGELRFGGGRAARLGHYAGGAGEAMEGLMRVCGWWDAGSC